MKKRLFPILAALLLAGPIVACARADAPAGAAPKESTARPAEAPPAAVVGIALRTRLEAVAADEVRRLGEETLYAAPHLVELYRTNDFQPLWADAAATEKLVRAIEAAADDGLNPEDYHLAALKAEAPPPEDQRDGLRSAIDLDLLRTDALITLGEHLRRGKAAERDVPEKAALRGAPAWEVDTDLYLAVILGGEIEKALAAFAPRHPLYQNLKNVLTRHRLAQDKTPEYPFVPPGGSIRPGMRGSRVDDLKDRLVASGELAAEQRGDDLYDAALTEAVRAFQKKAGLAADGVAGKNTIAALNGDSGQSAAPPLDKLRVNLERSRWLLRDLPDTAIIVDIPAYQLHYYKEGKPSWTCRVMVGRPTDQTPTYRSAINHLVLNPTWTIPPGMLKREILPRLQADPGYLQAMRLKVYNRQGKTVNPEAINWSAYSGRNFPFSLRQDAGQDNSLGSIKFMFPNPYHVYLHDTPSKHLFQRKNRALSHGCVRVQSPKDLGRLILSGDEGNPVSAKRFDAILASGKNAGLKLNHPLPVVLHYPTAKANEAGQVSLSADIYKLDAAVLAALNSPPRPLPARPVEEKSEEETAKAAEASAAAEPAGEAEDANAARAAMQAAEGKAGKKE